MQEIPSGLSDLFKEVLRRDHTNMDVLLLCPQRESSILQGKLGYSTAPVLTPSERQQLGTRKKSVEDMGRFVPTSSKGLADFTKSTKASTVKFIHESVRDFLMRDGSLRDIWPDLDDQLITRSHERLKSRCVSYLAADISGYVEPNQSLPKASLQKAREQRKAISDSYMFHVAESVFSHANKAALEIP